MCYQHTHTTAPSYTCYQHKLHNIAASCTIVHVLPSSTNTNYTTQQHYIHVRAIQITQYTTIINMWYKPYIKKHTVTYTCYQKKLHNRAPLYRFAYVHICVHSTQHHVQPTQITHHNTIIGLYMFNQNKLHITQYHHTDVLPTKITQHSTTT